MYQAKLYFRQEKGCILEELTHDAGEPLSIEIEELHDDKVTFVLESGNRTHEHYETLDATDHVEHVERLDEHNILVTKPSCGAYSAIYKNHGTLQRSNVISGKQRVYNILVFRRDDLKDIITDMRTFGVVTLGKLEQFGERQTELTTQQRKVVHRALERGYFDWPRQVKSEDLAAELGISKATLLEHLRKAERKLLENSLDNMDRVSLADREFVT